MPATTHDLNPLLESLVCLRCGASSAPSARAYTCDACAGRDDPDPGILDARYDDARAGDALRAALHGSSPTDVFRWSPLLPVRGASGGMTAGGTPLIAAPRLAARLGARAVWVKDETRNPTRCLKDRATAVAMSLARVAEADIVYCASAGNAAISLAGFAANEGVPCRVYVPSYASAVRLDWLRRFGAEVHVSAGDYDQAFDEAERDGAAHGWFSRNCAVNPFLVEGKKTVALEIAEQLGWEAPDWVVAPVGDGCTLGAVGKGFAEARRLGLTDHLPRLLGVQPESTQPLVERFTGVRSSYDGPQSAAQSMLVRRPRNGIRLLTAVRESRGRMLAVSDAAIAEAQALLAREAGVVCELTSAATLAGALQLTREDVEGRTVVLVVTGGRVD